MSGRIWAASLFLCMCLELGGSSARLRRWKREDRLQTARKDSQVQRLDMEEGQSEMPFANTAGTPSLRLTDKNDDNLMILPKSNKEDHVQIEKTGFEITLTPVLLSGASVNTDSTPHIMKNFHPKSKDIPEITKTTASPLSQNSKISRISQDDFIPTELTPVVEVTETEHGEKGPDRSTLDGLSDSSVILLKPLSGLKNSGQEVQTIMIGSQDAESSGDFHRTFTQPNLDEMPSQSRSRRSWIWNQFFVIEEYSGPEPVLIGRVR